MLTDYNKNVFEELSSTTGLKFKSQIRESGIRLESLKELENIVDGGKHSLVITNTKNISFNSTSAFLKEFISLLESNLLSLEVDLERVLKGKQQNFYNEVALNYEEEALCNYQMKQEKLLKKVQPLQSELTSRIK